MLDKSASEFTGALDFDLATVRRRGMSGMREV